MKNSMQPDELIEVIRQLIRDGEDVAHADAKVLLREYDKLRNATTPALSYRDGLEAAAKVADAETGRYSWGNMMYGPAVAPKIAAAIRALAANSQSLPRPNRCGDAS